jgi:hypothetical protein
MPTKRVNSPVPYAEIKVGLELSDPTSPEFVGVYSPPPTFGAGGIEKADNQTTSALTVAQVSRVPSEKAIELAARTLAKRAMRKNKEESIRALAERHVNASGSGANKELFPYPSPKSAETQPQLNLILQRSGTLDSQNEMWEEHDLDWPDKPSVPELQ